MEALLAELLLGESEHDICALLECDLEAREAFGQALIEEALERARASIRGRAAHKGVRLAPVRATWRCCTPHEYEAKVRAVYAASVRPLLARDGVNLILLARATCVPQPDGAVDGTLELECGVSHTLTTDPLITRRCIYGRNPDGTAVVKREHASRRPRDFLRTLDNEPREPSLSVIERS
jgi:hypothetical protein